MSKLARSLLAALGLAAVMPALAWAQPMTPAARVGMELIRVSQDGRRFVLAESGAEFRPWGLNGFYWGKTIAEYRREGRSIAEAITLDWLEYFARKTPNSLRPTAAQPVELPGDRPPERVPVRGHAAPGNDRMPWK